MIVSSDLENWFMYHESENATETAKYETIRSAAKVFAEVILANTPASADQTVAVRTVREAVMWANASIACGGR